MHISRYRIVMPKKSKINGLHLLTKSLSLFIWFSLRNQSVAKNRDTAP